MSVEVMTDPPVMTDIAMANDHRNSEFSHEKMVIFQHAMFDYWSVPSGNLLHNYGSNHHFEWENPTISVVNFHSYVNLPEGKKQLSSVFEDPTQPHGFFIAATHGRTGESIHGGTQ